MSARQRVQHTHGTRKELSPGDNTINGKRRATAHVNSSGLCFCWCVGVAISTICVTVAVVWAIPSPIDPVSFRYHEDPCPEFVGPMEVNDHLKKGRKLLKSEIVGPEGFAVDSDGRIYTGLADGRIIRLAVDLQSYETVVRTGKPPFDECGTLDNEKLCGRPLGLHFHPKIPDELYVADSSIGIIKVNVKSRQVTTVVLKNSILGDRGILNFPNDLVVLANETVLFTDSSRKYSRHQNRLEFFESRAHGELLYYNPSDETYGVLKEGMFFPNGICLTQDGNALLIAETTRARILRYYLDGPNAGKSDVFADNLPGSPDNISPSSSGGYWVGIALVRNPLIDLLSDTFSFMRSVIIKLGIVHTIEKFIQKHGLVLELDSTGLIKQSLHDLGGDTTHATSHILDLGDRLLIGSYFEPFILEVML